MRDKNIHFQVELKEKIYKKMMDFCKKNHTYRNTFIRNAIISKLMFDEDFQKEILSEIGKEENRDFFITMKLNFEAINKFKKEYEECARFVETYLSNGIGRKCYWSAKPKAQKKSGKADWILVSPSGDRLFVNNLRGFVRSHPDLFEIDGSDIEVKRVTSGLSALKTSLENGKKYRYRGWTIELPEEQK